MPLVNSLTSTRSVPQRSALSKEKRVKSIRYFDGGRMLGIKIKRAPQVNKPFSVYKLHFSPWDLQWPEQMASACWTSCQCFGSGVPYCSMACPPNARLKREIRVAWQTRPCPICNALVMISGPMHHQQERRFFSFILASILQSSAGLYIGFCRSCSTSKSTPIPLICHGLSLRIR